MAISIGINRFRGTLLLLLSLAGTCFPVLLHAQKDGQERIDSLRTVLATAPDGTDRVDALNDLSKFGGLLVGDLDTALHYATAARTLAEKIVYRKGLADAYHNLGYFNNSTGNYQVALDDYGSALTIYQEIGNERGAARTFNTLGNVHADMGDFPEALTNYFAALKLFEQLDDQRGIGNAYNNMGLVYSAQGDFREALQYLTEGLRISESTGFKLGIGNAYTNIGNLYLHQGDYPEALRNYEASLEIKTEIGDKSGIAMLYTNMGIIHQDQGNVSAALKDFHAALALFEEIGHGPGITNSYGAIGSIHIDMGHASDGRRWLHKALEAARDMGDQSMLQYAYLDLSKADSAMADFRSAFDHYKMYVQYRDSLINEENTKRTVQLQMQYEFDKKEAVTQAEQDKKDALASAELRKQKVIRNAAGGVVLIVLVFSTVVYRQRNRISKEKQRSEELLLNILPEEVAEELKAKGAAEARSIDQVTVLFTDFKGFTAMSEQVSPRQLVKDLNECFSAFDHIMDKHGMEKIKTIGDAYMAAGGLPTPNSTHTTDAIRAALEMRDFIEEGKARKIAAGLPYFEIRIGIHTGPVVAGIVGVKKFQYDIWGDTVNTASRMESSGEVGKVNISETTYQLVRAQLSVVGPQLSGAQAERSRAELTTDNRQLTSPEFTFTHRGKVEAKGKGALEMYFVRRSTGDD